MDLEGVTEVAVMAVVVAAAGVTVVESMVPRPNPADPRRTTLRRP